MNILLSLILEELKMKDVFYEYTSYEDQPACFSSFCLANKDTSLETDKLYITDISTLAALSNKEGASFILLDHLDVLAGLDDQGKYNLIRVKENFFKEDLVNLIANIFSKYWTWERSLLRLVNGNENIKKILDFLKEETNLSLAINDSKGQPLFTNLKAEDKRIKSHTFRDRSKAIGSISLYDNLVNSKDYQTYLFAEVVSILHDRLEDFFTSRVSASKELAVGIFQALVQGESLDQSYLSQLDKLSWKEADTYLLASLSGLSQEEEREISDLLNTDYDDKSIFIKFEESYLILLNTSQIDRDVFVSELAYLVEDSSKALVVISNPFDHLTKIKDVYQEIKQLASKAKAGSYDLAKDSFKILISTIDLETSLINKEIIKLKEHDLKEDDELLETLYVYLACERSYAKASELLNLHRNTIVYRIKKINGIVDLDLDNIHTRIHCLLSCLLVDEDLINYT